MPPAPLLIRPPRVAVGAGLRHAPLRTQSLRAGNGVADHETTGAMINIGLRTSRGEW
jgi:hypothetical protein